MKNYLFYRKFLVLVISVIFSIIITLCSSTSGSGTTGDNSQSISQGYNTGTVYDTDEDEDEDTTEVQESKLGKFIGVVRDFDGAEIVVSGKDDIGVQAPMGCALVLEADGQYIYLESTFPMSTMIKCKVTSGNRKLIKKGMKVYLKPSGKEIKKKDTILANFVQIEGGTFIMGSPASEAVRADGEVQHKVTVSSFKMSKYLVTQKEYEEVMGNNPSKFKGSDLPVETVDWYEAIEYCNKRSIKEKLTPAYTIDKNKKDPNNENSYDDEKWIVTWNKNANGYRLSTEAEWEYACRAGTTTPFSTGNNITTDQANYNGNYPYNNNAKGIYREKTTPVGTFKPNPWGLYDMHGNVWEWCWDWYGDYSKADQTNPDGTVSGSHRVIRGGSWFNYGQSLRSAYRSIGVPGYGLNYIGFRLVRS